MSIFASILRTAYKLSGAKKAFGLPENEIRKVIDKQNRSRGVFMPTDCKAHYEMITVNGFPCLIVRENPMPSERAILYFFGGGMVIGPDKGDLPVMRKLMQATGCDMWFPFYPLCTEHCITDTYDMVYECYHRMIELYGGGNVSTCGFSSGGALALAVADRVLMLENALYSVISPRGCASILWKDPKREAEAADTLHITAQDLYSFGMIEGIIQEGTSSAQLIRNVARTLRDQLAELDAEPDIDTMLQKRYEKFRRVGVFRTINQESNEGV